MPETAVPTTSVIKTYRKLMPEPSVIDETDKEQMLVADLVGDPRYEAYKNEMQKLITQLERSLQSQREPSDTVESIGFRYLAVDIAKKYIQTIISLPEAIGDGIKRE